MRSSKRFVLLPSRPSFARSLDAADRGSGGNVSASLFALAGAVIGTRASPAGGDGEGDGGVSCARSARIS